jgi:hypothetical protein
MRQLEPWLQNCRKSVCYVEEMWREEPKTRRKLVRQLAKFDHILLGCYDSIEPLAEEIERPVTYFPPAVDSLAFCPYPDPPERCIDIYWMGRRTDLTHEALRALASDRSLFYLYDTIRGNHPVDYREHRRLLAELIMRTKYFVANPAKRNDVPGSTHGQQELGSRHFEGAAGGAVMIGKVPETPVFAKYFTGEGAVFDMPYDTDDVASVYDTLESEPQAVERMRLANLRQSLLKHDWAYHWREFLPKVGMEPLPQLTARIEHLGNLAAAIRSDGVALPVSKRG